MQESFSEAKDAWPAATDKEKEILAAPMRQSLHDYVEQLTPGEQEESRKNYFGRCTDIRNTFCQNTGKK